RESPRFAASITTELHRLGLVEDGAVMLQSTRAHAYADALGALRRAGLAFPCWCSRADIAAHGGRHRDGHCVHAPDRQRRPAWRLLVPDTTIVWNDLLQGPQRQNLRTTVGDFVLR